MPPDVVDGKADEDQDGADEEVDPQLAEAAEAERQADLDAAAGQEVPRETTQAAVQVNRAQADPRRQVMGRQPTLIAISSGCLLRSPYSGMGWLQHSSSSRK